MNDCQYTTEDINRIIAAVRRDPRCIGAIERRWLCDEIERLRKADTYQRRTIRRCNEHIHLQELQLERLWKLCEPIGATAAERAWWDAVEERLRDAELLAGKDSMSAEILRREIIRREEETKQ